MNTVGILLIFTFGCLHADSCKNGWMNYKNESCYFITDVKELWNDGVSCILAFWNIPHQQPILLPPPRGEQDCRGATYYSGYRKEGVWIGGFNVGTAQNTWRWTIFEPLSFTDLNSGQPDSRKDGNCLGLHKSTGYNWHDYPCSSYTHVSLCEIENQVSGHQKEECCCTAKYLLKELTTCLHRAVK